MKTVDIFVDVAMDILFIMFALMISTIFGTAISGFILMLIQ